MRKLLQLILGLMAIILTGCANSEPQPLLKVGIFQWPGYQPVLLARELGFYDKAQIKLAELPATTDVLHLLHNGELDAATLTLGEALAAIAQATTLSAILIFDISNGADALIVKPSINDLQELKGKRIGMENTAVANIMLYSALKQAKLDEQDIHLVHLTMDEHISAYQRDDIDAIITFEPFKTSILKQGGNQLFTSRMIPNLIIDVLVVRTEVLEKQHSNIQVLVDGYYKARHYMLTNDDDAMQRMALGLGITPTELQSAFKDLKLPTLAETKAFFSGSPSPFEHSANRVLKVLQHAETISQSLEQISLQNNMFLSTSQP